MSNPRYSDFHKETFGTAREAVYATGQVAAVTHVAAYELDAAAYAIKAVRAAAPEGKGERYNFPKVRLLCSNRKNIMKVEENFPNI